MKKLILLFIAIFSISLINAQTVGDLFTVDVIYEIKSLPTMTENGTVSVDATNKNYLNANLTIPVSVTDPGTSTTYDIIQIESQAFLNNTNITTLVVNCTELNASFRSFENNTSLETVSMPNLTTWNNPGRSFEDCLSLTSVSIPNYSGTLQNQNFFLCENLVTVDLGNVTAIGNQNFQGCTSLESIDLPSLTNINNFTFTNCTSLKNVSAPLATSIERASFLNCTSLTEIILPSLATVDALNREPFEGCSNLAHIALGQATPPVITGTGSGALPAFTTLAANATLIVPAGASADYEATALWTDLSIVEGTLSKTATDITYSRSLGTENWYLVSSPVTDETYDDAYVVANNIDATGVVATNNAIGTYTTNGNTWSYMQDGTSASFTPGVGFSVKREDAAGAGNISFTGTGLNTGAVNDVPVSVDGDGFNLLGHPYLTNFDSGVFLTANGNLDGQIWLFNQATGNYETHVTGVNKILAPGQGFFVKATSGADVDFTYPSVVNATGVFQKTSRSEIKLLINSNNTERFAKIYFTESATAGFDKGWDGETFSGVPNELDVFTQLLENNTGKNYQIQSLSNATIETTVIPVGLVAAANQEITFSAETLNLADGVNVFLEDRETNTITRLDEVNTSYVVTLSEGLDGTGRFFIHTSTSSVLSTDSAVLEGVSVYRNASTLRIIGLSQGQATVKLFNILGKQMMNTSFEANGSDTVSLSKLATGIYIVQLETEKGKLSKKIILE